jgi:predicted Zn-dependent peptidase
MSLPVTVQRKVLPNGLTVVVERVPHFPSVTAGVWVKRGSRQEPPKVNGISHFIEHLVFKGTPTRTYSEIYRTFDRMGGVLDAFTSREIMGFYFRVQKAHFPEAFEVLSDMLARPTFPPEELERERGVILEEIKMVNDSPSDLVGDLFLARAYPGHPLGRPIQGDEQTIGRLTRGQVQRHYRAMMRPENLVVTATGDITLHEVLEQVAPTLGTLKRGAPQAERAPRFRPGVALFEKDHLEQAQLIVAFAAESAAGSHRFVLLVLANLLGGTMSSRLFTEIREKRGLVYSISAEHSGYRDGGLFGIQAASSHAAAPRTLKETLVVLADVAKHGVTEDEVEIAKDNLLGGAILSMESASSRMGRLARNELYFGQQRPMKESLDGISRVTASALVRQARELFQPKKALVAVMGHPSAVKHLDLGILGGRT